MLLDTYAYFGSALDASHAAGSAIVGDVIDLGSTNTTTDIGLSNHLYLVIQIVQASASSGGTSSTRFQLISDSAAALTTSPTVHYDSSALAEASVTAGRVLIHRVDPGDFERYIGMRVTIGTETTTAGTFTAFLTTDPARWTAYKDAVN